MSSRRDFFRKIGGKKDMLYLHPPYYSDIDIFDNCIECSNKDCKSACSEDIIVIAANGAPILNFSKSGCTFCQDCATACSLDVLKVENEQKKIDAIFVINKDSCMSHHHSICFACKEPCIEDAILFKGMFEPIIDIDNCTGCGFCISRCPTNAIEYIIRG